MKKIAIIIGVIVILLIGGVLLLGGDNRDRVGDGGINTPGDWVRYQNDELAFFLSHPPEVKAGQETENRVKFAFIGPDAAPNTEITDGYTLTVGVFQKSDYESLMTLAEEQAESTEQIGEIVQPIEETKFDDQHALTFTGQTITSPATHIFFEGSDYYYQLTEIITDPADRDYQSEVDLMKETFRTTP